MTGDVEDKSRCNKGCEIDHCHRRMRLVCNHDRSEQHELNAARDTQGASKKTALCFGGCRTQEACSRQASNRRIVAYVWEVEELPSLTRTYVLDG